MQNFLEDGKLFHTQCYSNGTWSDADDGATIEVLNPCTNSPIGTVPCCGTAETRRAIAAARTAFSTWSTLTPVERGGYLLEWHRQITTHAEDLARLLTLEQGKPLAEARAELAQGATYFPWYAEECRRAYGEVIPSPRHGVRPFTRRHPIGVAAAITPWNFPMSMIARKAAPALAAGCTMVLKPASNTPYSALALAELAHRAGLPRGVFNVITGDSQHIGKEITDNGAVRKISFTGSTKVGKHLMAHAANTVQRLSLELGGNAPFLVFAGADQEAAVTGCIASKFRNAGQTCICANRILVQRAVHDLFVERLMERVAKLKIGNGLDPGVELGPLISRDAVAHTEELIADALQKGATILTGGHRVPGEGNFYAPTVLTGVTPRMRVFREEIFGPVAPILVFDTEQEAVALANDTSYGLASYLYSRDLGQAWRVSENLEFGLVGVNDVGLSSAEIPFGGIKESGMGREGGREGLAAYLETRYVLMGGLENIS